MKKVLMFSALLLAIVLAHAQTITVTSPNGGEVWNTGYSWDIKWASQLVTDVDIELSTDDGASWTSIATNQPSTGIYSWNNQANPSMAGRVRIKSSANNSVSDQSNGNFIIGPIALIATSGDTSTCAGVPVTLFSSGTVYYNDGTGGGGGPPPPPGLTYQWAPEEGLSDPAIANPIATPTVTTTYTVTISDSHGISASAAVTVLVSNPDLSLSARQPVANYLRIDSILATVGAGEVIAYYEWFVDDLPIGTGASYITYNYPGTFMCTVINSNGCRDTATITIDGGLTVTVDSFADVTCSNDPSGYIATSVTGGTAPYYFRWNRGDSTSRIDNIDAGIYRLIVGDGSGKVGVVAHQINSSSSISAVSAKFMNGSFPDSIVVNVSGGNGSVTYLWSNGATSAVNVVNTSGIYTCVATDASGCSATTSDIIGTVPTDDLYDVIHNSPNAFQVLDNDVYTSQSGWRPKVAVFVTTSPHGSINVVNETVVTYTPNFGYAGADSFVYTLCLGDSGTNYYCSDAMVRVSVVDTIIVDLVINNTCQTNNSGSITAVVTGGTPPYKYEWTNGDTTQTVTGLPPGSYRVGVTDATNRGMYFSGFATITAGTVSIQIGPIADSIQVSITGTNDPWGFVWSTGITDTSMGTQSKIITNGYGQYCVTATNLYTGCIITACDTVGCSGCVWPGDADNSSIADNNDLLPIGLAYGATGSVRPGASLTWNGQASPDWTDTLASGTNYKHIDCDGNGVINADDTMAIVLNFGRSYIRSANERKAKKEGLPELKVTLSPDTLRAGDIMTATLRLGDAAMPAVDVYGLAFTLNYDLDIVDTTTTSITIGDSWLGNSTDKISVARDMRNGKVQIAITRIDRTVRSGSGIIGTVSFVITTDNINGKNLEYYGMESWISNLKAINNEGTLLDINEGADSAQVEYTPTGINELDNNANLKVFPNPADDQLTIECMDKAMMNEVTITGLLGNVVYRQQLTAQYRSVINVSQLHTGTYFVEVKTDKGIFQKRVLVAR